VERERHLAVAPSKLTNSKTDAISILTRPTPAGAPAKRRQIINSNLAAAISKRTSNPRKLTLWRHLAPSSEINDNLFSIAPSSETRIGDGAYTTGGPRSSHIDRPGSVSLRT
jgi:hypothetical protein